MGMVLGVLDVVLEVLDAVLDAVLVVLDVPPPPKLLPTSETNQKSHSW